MRRYSQRLSQRSSYKPRSVRRLEQRSKKNILITIGIVLFLVYFLLTWGLPALIGSLSIFNKLKPTENNNSLSAVEDAAIAPPVLNIPFESTNSAQIKISGYAAPKTTVEIYLDSVVTDTVTVDNSGQFEAHDISLSEGSNNIHGVTIDGDKKSLPSKNIRVYFSNEKPKLEVTEPGDGTQKSGGDKRIRVAGKTDPNNRITINGVTAIVNSEGNFGTDINLNDGENVLTIMAISAVGNTTQIERRVTYTP